MKQNIHIGALVSGRGTNLQAIIDARKRGEVKGVLKQANPHYHNNTKSTADE